MDVSVLRKHAPAARCEAANRNRDILRAEENGSSDSEPPPSPSKKRKRWRHQPSSEDEKSNTLRKKEWMLRQRVPKSDRRMFRLCPDESLLVSWRESSLSPRRRDGSPLPRRNPARSAELHLMNLKWWYQRRRK